MCNFVELTQKGNPRKASIQVELVAYFQSEIDRGSQIVFASGVTLHVSESYEEIKKSLKVYGTKES